MHLQAGIEDILKEAIDEIKFQKAVQIVNCINKTYNLDLKTVDSSQMTETIASLL